MLLFLFLENTGLIGLSQGLQTVTISGTDRGTLLGGADFRGPVFFVSS